VEELAEWFAEKWLASRCPAWWGVMLLTASRNIDRPLP
jgi:hypothetical protein